MNRVIPSLDVLVTTRPALEGAGVWLAFGFALAVNAWSLSQPGYVNTYYAAAVRSMNESWHNFFFVAYDPGGFISVDKPPVFLWVDALSARLLGYSSPSLLLPSVVAGALTGALVWLIMRRHFGGLAAITATLALVLAPIAVAVNRLNMPEPFLVLALAGAAGCVLRSLESRHWLAWTAGAGMLVGVAFNIKMLAGWVPAPALALAIAAGMEGDWWLKWREWLPRVAVYAGVALLVSVSWMLVVDSWPADSRPYVGGSTDNSVYDLALGYNGLERLEEDISARANLAGIIGGSPGPLRMFDSANGGQIGWLLPFAAIGGVMSLWHWRQDRVLRAAVITWLGWLLLFGAAFSFAQGTYHSYYTVAMVPAVAALTGITAAACRDLLGRDRSWVFVVIALAIVTLWVQLTLAGRHDDFFNWVPYLTVVAVVGGAALIYAGALRKERVLATAGILGAIGGLLLIPAAWSVFEATHPPINTTLPQAGPRTGSAASRSFGAVRPDSQTHLLAQWLLANRDAGVRWDLVTQAANISATMMTRYEVSVMALGGFSGSDPTITAEEFRAYVTSGEVRYVLTPEDYLELLEYSHGREIDYTKKDWEEESLPYWQAYYRGRAGANAVLVSVITECERVKNPPQDAELGTLYDCAAWGATTQ
jgi:4-amino-4-deoxy-L-arabinose transferase-like glycosyltransferase